MTNKEHVIVIGAGIVGVATAIWLQRSGFKVTIVDREGVASAASFGNAGVLAANSIVPVTTPGILKKAPGMLFSKDQPLFMRWTYLPKLLPFLVRYLSYANTKDVEWIAKGLADLMHDSFDQHFALAKGTPAEQFIKPNDFTFLYADEKAFLKDKAGWDLRRKHGLKDEELDAQALGEYDPALKGRFGYAVRGLNQGQITDPGAYTKALAEYFIEVGGTIEIASVSDIIVENNHAKGVQTNKGEMQADHVVIASGIWSGKLTEKLGAKVPIESERGYHLEFYNPNIRLRAPSMVSSGKFVMNSMDGRLRCAGVVEFGGIKAGPSKVPFEMLQRKVSELFPDLEYERIEKWMGHRPSTSDSLPLIGALAKIPNVWTGFGHQHLGLTGAAKTGRWIAQMMSGEQPNIDMKPFSPDRF